MGGIADDHHPVAVPHRHVTEVVRVVARQFEPTRVG
jgi:hypothetical protein